MPARAANLSFMDAGEQLEVFTREARRIGLVIAPHQQERLLRAATWLAQLSHSSGISGYETTETALMRGMAPALAYFSLPTPRTGLLVDIGAGNGALGATIAILAENLTIHLVDRAERAYTACEILAARLALPNLIAFRMNTEEAPPHTYDAAVLRAFAPAASALPTARRLTRPGGWVVAYHRFDDTAFLTPDAALTIMGTAATLVPGLVASAYRV